MSTSTSNERLLNLIRQTNETNPGFVATDLHGDRTVIPEIRREKQRPAPMSLAEMFHLKEGTPCDKSHSV